MAANLKANRRRLREPIYGWEPLNDRRIVYYGLESLGAVRTTGGEMMKVKISLKADLRRPDADVAAMVGTVRLADCVDDVGTGPELWFWGSDYWVKATEPFGNEWYKNHAYLIHRVEVTEPEGFLEKLRLEREQILAAKVAD